MRGCYFQILYIRLVNWEGLTLEDGLVNGLIFINCLVVVKQYLRRISLAINIDKENLFSLRASPAAREIEVVVFPVPPFWLAIEIIIDQSIHTKPLRGFFVNCVTASTIAELIGYCQVEFSENGGNTLSRGQTVAFVVPINSGRGALMRGECYLRRCPFPFG